MYFHPVTSIFSFVVPINTLCWAEPDFSYPEITGGQFPAKGLHQVYMHVK